MLSARWLSLVVVLTAGCLEQYSKAADARLQLESAESCPADRITVGPSPGPLPPPEISADAARRALWNAEHGDTAYYVARGCGVERVYGYTHRGVFTVSRREYAHDDGEPSQAPRAPRY